MNWKRAERIADAVLYEGYLLYPYRASALKNRRRLMFGTLDPGASIGTEFLCEGSTAARITVKARFLQEQSSSIEAKEVLVEPGEQSSLVECSGEPVEGGLSKMRLRINNESRPQATLYSCHALIAVEGGAFLSMTDPRSASCERRGLWPILVDPDRTLLLASPILLPDCPAIAPESPNDLCDLTEIDEILSLRILTLSDGEKEELRRGDERGRRVLERTENLTGPQLLALHGASRTCPRPGDRIRLRPNRRADIMDLALDGREATVVAVEEDLEGNRHLAVTVDEDPGRDLGELGFLGHRFFFRPEEVEPL